MYNINFDNTLYKLDDVYNTISHNIIKKKEDLGLINYGIKDLLSINIKNWILKYIYSTNSKDILNFSSSISSIKNLLIVLKTTDYKRFGVFYQNNNINIRWKNDVNSFCGNCNKKLKSSIKRLFCTCYKIGQSFIFSFDKFKVYENINENPNFNIKYDYNRECLFGNEFILKKQIEKKLSFNINDSDFNENINILRPVTPRVFRNFNKIKNIFPPPSPREFETTNHSSFVLHGHDKNSEEFNILNLEVYDIEVRENDNYWNI